MEEEEYRTESEVEPDSDHDDDSDLETQLGQWLGELESIQKGLGVGETDTVRRRNKTVVTPKMTMESFRFSFLNENTDVNFDTILGELCELTTQLNTTSQAEQHYYSNPCRSPAITKDEHRDSGNDLAQQELDALASEITRSLGYRKTKPMTDLEYFHSNYPGDLGGCSDTMFDIGETDSAFSDNASLPSSESFTSMVTVSSSADTGSSGDACSSGSTNTLTPQSQHSDDEQKALLQAEKIRIALEKIKEAKIKKLFVRAFAKDGSSKSILVDEKMTIAHVVNILADKNHLNLNFDLTVVEHMPDLYMERILEDHDTLVENMVMWTRDTKNRILFEPRVRKNDLFKCPEKYLLMSSSSEKGASLDPKRRENLIQDFFSGSAAQVPEVEGVLYLKSEGKKAWKKFFFVLRASGIYYNPKGKMSKAPKDLTCLVQFEYVELYLGLGWKKKYHAPTDFCFALKHPQIQKKTSKFIRYLCAENKSALDQWVMGIRIAKFGKQLLHNYHSLQQEIIGWDSRQLRTSISDPQDVDGFSMELNPQGDLHDSLLSMPEPGSRHSIVTVKNIPVRPDSKDLSVVSDELVYSDCSSSSSQQFHERKPSLTGQVMSDSQPRLVPVKRVSFSNTHSVINADCGEEMVSVRHRDSITSASTDSSEDSTSSGEGRMTVSHRSKMRPKLPVTTGTTRQISEMVQMSVETQSMGSFDGSLEEISSPNHRDREFDRRKSAPVCNSPQMCMDRRADIVRELRASSGHTQSYNAHTMSPTSPQTSSPQHMKGSRIPVPPSPQPNKSYMTHSRGSSLSSVDSGDSFHGQMFSPTSPSPHGMGPGYDYDQANWPLYESIHQMSPQSSMGQGLYQGQGQQQKQAPPTAQKPIGGRVVMRSQSAPPEKGHKRNSSKSSLESVEESPTKGRSSMVTSPPPAPIPVSSPIPPRAMTMNVPPPQPPTTVVKPQPSYMHQQGGQHQQQQQYQQLHQQQQYQHHQQQQHQYQQQQQSSGSCSPASQGPGGPVPPPPTPPNHAANLAGSLSPRPASHRSSGLSAKPVPPPLVPPVPRSTSAGGKTHKKRPSGGGAAMVNGNEITPRSPMSGGPVNWSQTASVNSPASPVAPAGAEESNYASLPFLEELNKQMVRQTNPPNAGNHPQHSECGVKVPPSTYPKPIDQRPQTAAMDNVKTNSNFVNSGAPVTCSGSIGQDKMGSRKGALPPPPPPPPPPTSAELKKGVPPPPPRRSETTKLSSSTDSKHNAPLPPTHLTDSKSNVPNETDPIYGNCEGIVDINDLPPPPPELLEGWQENGNGDHSQGEEGALRGRGKPPPPPPPPKRNKETHLSTLC